MTDSQRFAISAPQITAFHFCFSAVSPTCILSALNWIASTELEQCSFYVTFLESLFSDFSAIKKYSGSLVPRLSETTNFLHFANDVANFIKLCGLETLLKFLVPLVLCLLRGFMYDCLWNLLLLSIVGRLAKPLSIWTTSFQALFLLVMPLYTFNERLRTTGARWNHGCKVSLRVSNSKLGLMLLWVYTRSCPWSVGIGSSFPMTLNW